MGGASSPAAGATSAASAEAAAEMPTVVRELRSAAPTADAPLPD